MMEVSVVPFSFGIRVCFQRVSKLAGFLALKPCRVEPRSKICQLKHEVNQVRLPPYIGKKNEVHWWNLDQDKIPLHLVSWVRKYILYHVGRRLLVCRPIQPSFSPRQCLNDYEIKRKNAVGFAFANMACSRLINKQLPMYPERTSWAHSQITKNPLASANRSSYLGTNQQNPILPCSCTAPLPSRPRTDPATWAPTRRITISHVIVMHPCNGGSR